MEMVRTLKNVETYYAVHKILDFFHINLLKPTGYVMLQQV